MRQQLLKFLVPLFQDIAINEVNVLQANFNNLVLENEQLKSEIYEMKEKLKEKKEIDEFEALEKQTQKDHEVLCIQIVTYEFSMLKCFLEFLQCTVISRP